MVWCAISEKGISGNKSFENEIVTVESYKTLHQYAFSPKLRDYHQNLLFKRDAASLQFDLPVHRFLDPKLASCWSGRGGPVSKQLRASDLSIYDFSLKSFMKDHIFTNRHTTIAELRTGIQTAIASIYEDNLLSMVNKTEFCLRLLLRQNSAHLKNRLSRVKHMHFLLKKRYKSLTDVKSFKIHGRLESSGFPDTLQVKEQIEI